MYFDLCYSVLSVAGLEAFKPAVNGRHLMLN